MKKTVRILSLILCVVLVSSLLAAVPGFADEGKPGPDDIKGASKYLTGPKDESWLDEYKEGYAIGPGYGIAAYRYLSSRAAKNTKSVNQGTKLTLLAYERSRYLVKTESGDIFWIADGCVSDHYVAPGRPMTDNPDVDANGPCLDDLEGIKRDVDRPGMYQWLDEKVECYVYGPRHHKAAEMFYYYKTPTSEEAIEKGYDINRQMGSVKQGTAITLLAHAGNRYLVKTDTGLIFWMYDWCTSDTLVPYGEAKED